jgi:pimeloyl-ACP methyl ester carboxylesterase/DNA-binding SARP family transcriptional activator
MSAEARTRLRTRSVDNREVLCLLGPPALAEAEGLRPLELRPKALALLARLALTDEPQERNTLAELLFHDAANPRDSLRWYLSYLRARLPEAMVVDRRVASVRIQTDVAAFRSGAERILSDPSAPGGAETLAVYRGDLCAGLQVEASADFHNWLYVQEDELRRTFRRAVVAFARHALADGPAMAAIPSLRLLTEIDPYLEDGHALLMQLNEAAGEWDAARHAYDRYQRIVRTELHAEPRRELALRYEPERPAGRSLPHDELVSLREVTMHVVDWPGGEPAILAVHGSAGHAYGLTALGEQLAPDVRFVAVDLRGHGFTDKPPSGYQVRDHVEDLLQLLATLDLHRPILLGHSIGGAIATLVAEGSRGRIGGLILFDAVVGDRLFVESASFVVDAFGTSLEQRFASFDDYHRRWAAEPGDSEWKRWLERSDRMELAPLPGGTFRRRGLRQALAAEWASVARADALVALSRVSVPVLVVYADAVWKETPYLDEATVDAQLAAARDSRLYVARGQHHADIIRRPSDGLVRALKDFVKHVRATTPATQPESRCR